MSIKKLSACLIIPALLSVISCSKDDDADETPAPTSTVNTYTINMGGQANTAHPNIYDVETNRGFSIINYDTKKDSIDLVYYYDESGSETYVLSSPDNPTLLTLSNYWAYIDADSLASASHTDFRKITAISTTEFDNLTSKTQVETYFNGAGTSSNRIFNLAVNDIFGIRMPSGKYAIVKVKYISAPATTSSSIEFVLKLQQ